MLPRQLRIRVEVAASAVSAVLAALTIARRDWLEAVFGIDPDGGNGSAEWLIVAAFLALAVALLSLARHEVRASRRASYASGGAG